MIFIENCICENYFKIIKGLITFCGICRFAKDKNYHKENFPKSIVPDSPSKLFSVDFITNLISGYQSNGSIFGILDIFSKFISIYSCKKNNTVNKLFLIYFTEVGKPEKCIIDNATYSNNERLIKILQK